MTSNREWDRKHGNFTLKLQWAGDELRLGPFAIGRIVHPDRSSSGELVLYGQPVSAQPVYTTSAQAHDVLWKAAVELLSKEALNMEAS